MTHTWKQFFSSASTSTSNPKGFCQHFFFWFNINGSKVFQFFLDPEFLKSGFISWSSLFWQIQISIWIHFLGKNWRLHGFGYRSTTLLQLYQIWNFEGVWVCCCHQARQGASFLKLMLQRVLTWQSSEWCLFKEMVPKLVWIHIKKAGSILIWFHNTALVI